MRKGFTLVEILIVIVVMAILASMMTISMNESKLSADAANIVSRLRNAKVAAMAMYVDSLDLWETTTDGEDSNNKQRFTMDSVKKFLNDDRNYNDSFDIIQKADNTEDVYAKRKWYVVYKVGSNTKLKTKLEGRAVQDGLLGSDSITDDFSIADPFTVTYEFVLLRVK